MKTRSMRVKDTGGYGGVRFYTAPHDEIDEYGDNWQHKTKQVEYYYGFKTEMVAQDANVMLRFTQEDQNDFVIIVDKKALKAALKEVGL